MAKKYFDYGFQVKRTRLGLYTLIIVIIISVILFINWYSDKTVTEKVGNLSYKTFFGVNEFSSNDCNKAYRINYKKNTCATICINKIDINTNYLEEIKKSMEDDGFKFNNITTKKIGNETWDYLETKGAKPSMNYYSINNDKNTYTIEYIDQTDSLDNNIKEKCNTIIDKFNNNVIFNSK